MGLKSKIEKILANKNFQSYEKWASAIIWMLAIYYLSSKSLNFIVATDIWEFILRKIAHMFEYAVLTLLIFRILGQTEKRHYIWNIVWALIFTILYAISDEFHQTFTLNRVGTYRDVLIDSTGALISAWLIYINHRHKELLKLNKKIVP
ncbi:MAG: VanZ family protein [Patescibacteria group bacterium]|nr:VanZ family protein [Patescibacteria group bacterium]